MRDGTDDQGQPVNAYLNAAARARRDLNELLGVCKGIILDGKVTETEATGLAEWLTSHPDAQGQWPVSVITDRMQRILADGIITEDELEDLRVLLEEVTGSDDQSASGANRGTTLPLDVPEPEIDLPDHAFCFTGRFYLGTRKRCEKLVRERGGSVHTSVRIDTDYLVIGLLGSRDWLHASFGTKILKAVEYRDRGRGIAIVSEGRWSQFI